MTILVTNDDGILAPGLKVLVDVASHFGTTYVMAPETEQSGVSHAITLTEPLRVREIGHRTWALNGTPSDCVFIGMHHVLPTRPDLILSGINRGPNLGFDVLYSGTVAGAMEGTVQGVPAVAFSLCARETFPFEQVRGYVEAVLREVLDHGMPDGTMLNVNLPSPDEMPIRGVRVTRLGRRFYSNDIVVRKDPRGGEYLWIGGTRITMDSEADTDTGAVTSGYVSVTPLNPSLMAFDAMGSLDGYRRMRLPEMEMLDGVAVVPTA